MGKQAAQKADKGMLTWTAGPCHALRKRNPNLSKARPLVTLRLPPKESSHREVVLFRLSRHRQ